MGFNENAWAFAFEVDRLNKLAQKKHDPNDPNLILLVIRGVEMMNLVHELYKRAADEA